jgi:DNA polymerase III delta prime subunit
MIPSPSAVFALPDRLAAKRDVRLVSDDERQFAAIAESLQQSITEAEERLDAERRRPGGGGQHALERDLEIHRLTSRLRTLRRFGLDSCLGRMVPTDGGAPLYIGRFGLTDSAGEPLLVDWRSHAAEPFFAATRSDPRGIRSRRRYRWVGGRINDYWDELLVEDTGARKTDLALDDESAFIASLGQSRSPRMRDVLGTIQADQDAIIRAGSRGALVVDGGPGTGKTVVALHRTAYLLYSDPRVASRHGGVLLVGPNAGYLAYVEDVLPSLGEEGVHTATLRDLVPEGAGAVVESDPEVERVKSGIDTGALIDAAVRHYERAPESVVVETPWGDVELAADDWTDAFDAADEGTAHNDARATVWEAVVEIVADRLDGVSPALVARSLAQNEDLTAVFARAWPVLDPLGIVADLWTVASYLDECAPGLRAGHRQALHRADGRRWTVSDLPFLDAARARVGDPLAGRRAREHERTIAEETARRDRVVEELIAADDSELGLMSILRRRDAQNSLTGDASVPTADSDEFGGPFAHIVVDEAQELTDAEWSMLVRRCPTRSFTVVGDRAQARRPFAESWRERLERVGLRRADVATLTVNYRTPQEVMIEAEPVIRSVLPDANVPTSVRSTGVPVERGTIEQLGDVLGSWLAADSDGVACVIALDAERAARVPTDRRIRYVTPDLSKGLEFDLVVIVDPGAFRPVDLYVAMTRATQRLVLLSADE